MVSDWRRDAGLRLHPCGADALHLYPGLQQRIDAGAGKPGEPGHAACHLADGDDCVDYRTGEPGVRYLAGLAGDTFYLSGAPAAADVAGYPVRRLAGGGRSGVSAVLRL